MNQVHFDGWRVPRSAQAAVLAVSIPAAALGFLLTISLWFMMAGLPLLASSGCSIQAILHANRRGASHPALFVVFLAATEFAIGGLGWSVLPPSTGLPVAAAFSGVGAITGIIGWALWRSTIPAAPPPAPRQQMRLG